MNVFIEEKGKRVPASMKIENGNMVVTSEAAERDAPTDGIYMVGGWIENGERCAWVCIVKGDVALSRGGLYYETLCGVYTKESDCKPDGDLFWVDKDCDAATYMRIANEKEREYMDEALRKHRMRYNKKEGKLEEWPKMGDKYLTLEYSHISGEFILKGPFEYEGDEIDVAIIKEGWAFDSTTACEKKIKELNDAIKNL